MTEVPSDVDFGLTNLRVQSGLLPPKVTNVSFNIPSKWDACPIHQINQGYSFIPGVPHQGPGANASSPSSRGTLPLTSTSLSSAEKSPSEAMAWAESP